MCLYKPDDYVELIYSGKLEDIEGHNPKSWVAEDEITEKIKPTIITLLTFVFSNFHIQNPNDAGCGLISIKQLKVRCWRKLDSPLQPKGLASNSHIQLPTTCYFKLVEQSKVRYWRKSNPMALQNKVWFPPVLTYKFQLLPSVGVVDFLWLSCSGIMGKRHENGLMDLLLI